MDLMLSENDNAKRSRNRLKLLLNSSTKKYTEYNALMDKHLVNYFANSNLRKQLIRMNLIKRMYKRSHLYRVLDLSKKNLFDKAKLNVIYIKPNPSVYGMKAQNLKRYLNQSLLPNIKKPSPRSQSLSLGHHIKRDVNSIININSTKSALASLQNKLINSSMNLSIQYSKAKSFAKLKPLSSMELHQVIEKYRQCNGYSSQSFIGNKES